MSNGRRAGRGNTYRTGYLRSGEWFARRRRWFRDELSRSSGVLRCMACLRRATDAELELHHVSYDRVTRLEDGTWRAGERHEDLQSLHPWCHEQLHKLIDRDRVLSRMRRRPAASQQALGRLRRNLLRMRKDLP